MNKPDSLNPSGGAIGAPSRGDFDRAGAATERRSVDQMFLDYYGLSEQPFGVTPDLRFLYLGSKHRQALDVLNYGTDLNRGFLTLIAEAGMGKTSLLFHYLEGLRNTARTAFIFHTDCDSTELMRYLLADLGLDGKGMDLPEMRAVLSQVLMGEMQAGRRFVLVIDEAQNLDERVLESIRLLSNFETPWMKLMHIVLAGQPQLAERLAKPSMKQLRQRISFSVSVEPFTREEIDLYIDHRLWVAGYHGSSLFSVGARGVLAERSAGIPRNINNLCFCAMSYAWAMKRRSIDRDTMNEVLADADDLDRPADPVTKPVTSPATRFARSEPASAPLPPPMQPQQSISLLPPSQEDFALEPHRATSWLAKLGIVCVLGFVLGWAGLQPGVGKWMGDSVRSVSTAVRSFLVPAAAADRPADNAAPDNASPKSDTVPGAKGMTSPQ